MKVFLGTSSTLMRLRIAVSDKMRQVGMQLEKSGIRLELLMWEDHPAEFKGTSKQEEYDADLVLNSDIIFTVFKDKIGEYTLHELQVARNGGKKHIYCYCINCKQKTAVEVELKKEGFSTISVSGDIELLEDMTAKIMDFAKANAKSGSISPVAGITKNFYATIPDDMAGYRTSFSSMMRSLDMVTVSELDMHCVLYPYCSPDMIETTNHYVALFKNQVSDADVAETEQAMQMLDDASKPMEAMSIFQQKADRLDKSKKIRYDIRANNPKIKAITDSRTIFTIGMQSLDKVRLHLLLWCLRTKTLSISQTPNGFTCKDGMLLFYNHPIADMAMVEELSTLVVSQTGQRKLGADFMANIYLVLESMMNADGREDVLSDSDEPIDCQQLLAGQEAEEAMLQTIATQTAKKWEKDEQKLRNRRDFLIKSANDKQQLDELRQVQDTLLTVVRRKTQFSHNKLQLVSELFMTIGVYDTYLRFVPQKERDTFYQELIETADAIGYVDPAVEIMRMNWGNHFSRELLQDKAIEQYEKALANMALLDDHSRFVQRCLCHLYTTAIHSCYELDYRHPRVSELLQELKAKSERWSTSVEDSLFYQSVISAIELHVDFEGKHSYALVERAEKIFNELMERCPLSIYDQHYGEVMCYLPNGIAAYYLDHKPSSAEQAYEYVEKVKNYTNIQIKNAEAIKSKDKWDYLTYMGKAYHHLGFLYSGSSVLSDLKLSVAYYAKALKYREENYAFTQTPSDEINVAETLVNYGAVLLTINQQKSKWPIEQFPSPIPYSKRALAIYEKYKDNQNISDQLNYFKALQLYASTVFLLNIYIECGETLGHVIQMLRQCLDWSRQHPKNDYEETFEGVSGAILNAISKKIH